MSGSKYIWIFSGISFFLLRPALPAGKVVVNVARYGQAVQSSEYDDAGGKGAARNAIDGNRNPSLSAGSCIHTREESNPWWRLELDKEYNIYAVMISNSEEYADRLDGAELWLGVTLKNNGVHGFRCAVITNIPGTQTFYFSCRQMEARYISVFLPGSNKTLSFCEVEVYEHPRAMPLSNIALRGDATQSSTLAALSTAAKAIDARRNSDYANGSCSHTAENEPNPWWRVDLQKTRRILSVKITNRGDCCAERLDGAEIRIGNSLEDNGNNNSRCAFISHIAAGKTETFYCEGGNMEGRFVNVIIPGEKKTLTLCEVEVYTFPLAMEPQPNLALTGDATQRTTYGSHAAMRAIDGCVNSDLSSGCCSHTTNIGEPWWRLDMGTMKRVAAISIINRNDSSPERLIGVQIHIGKMGNKSDHRCSSIRKSKESYTILCYSQGGRFIFITAPGVTPLHLCEVEVYAAPKVIPPSPTSPPPTSPTPPPTPPTLPPPPPPHATGVLPGGRNATVVGLRLCWADALFYCRGHHWDLLSVRSQQEQSAVEKLLSRTPFPLTDHIWLGLRRFIMDDKWFWMSGEPMNFTQWTRDFAPLRYANPCGGIARDERGFLWRDQPCELLSNFICETGDKAGAGQVYYYSSYEAKGSL